MGLAKSISSLVHSCWGPVFSAEIAASPEDTVPPDETVPPDGPVPSDETGVSGPVPAAPGTEEAGGDDIGGGVPLSGPAQPGLEPVAPGSAPVEQPGSPIIPAGSGFTAKGSGFPLLGWGSLWSGSALLWTPCAGALALNIWPSFVSPLLLLQAISEAAASEKTDSLKILVLVFAVIVISAVKFRSVHIFYCTILKYHREVTEKLQNLKTKAIFLIDLQPSHFNLVLTPCQADFADLVTEFAGHYFTDHFTDYLLGENCLPHVTICQFQGPPISKFLEGCPSSELSEFLGTDKKRIIQLKFDHFYLRAGTGRNASLTAPAKAERVSKTVESKAPVSNAASFTVGLAVAFNPALLELQQNYFEKLKQLGYKPLTQAEDYFPHLTLARLAGKTLAMPSPVDFWHFFQPQEFELGLALSNPAGVMLRPIF